MSTIPLTLCFLFLFIYHFEEVFAAPTRHLCRPDQRDALLKFKDEFEIGKSSHEDRCFFNESLVIPHPKTESWANSSDCCSWEGVTCNAKSGEVIELNLNCCCLYGRFKSNSSLQSLRFLTALDLSYNDFSDQIPSWIGKLSHLTSLKLSDNHFLGEIPSSIGNLSNLTFLDLSDNDFFGQMTPSIGNLTQLTSLDLSNNRFHGQIMSSFGNLYKLTYLDLYRNNFNGEVPSSLGNLNQLKELYLSSNKLTGNFSVALLNLTQLSWLLLSRNRFVGRLPPNITLLSKLMVFYASHNAFTGNPLSSLIVISSLENVDLGDNQLSGTLEFANISSPSKLEWLYIGNNNFTGPIPSSISKLTNLRILDLSHFNTQGPIDVSIFSHLKSLRVLQMSNLKTTTTIDLNDILQNIKSLRILDVSGNHVSITNESLVSDPSSHSLIYLNLSGCSVTKFPELLKTHQELEELDISNNKINGQVPGWLWTLPYLMYVSLSNNVFTGFENSTRPALSPVPNSSMQYLFGSSNNFTSKIPSFICGLRSLRILDLSNNNFDGSFPLCMRNLKSSLSVLNLRQNRLHGGLPEGIYERLTSLDVGHNQLEEKLPRSLINFTNLEVLNVESNRINDTFPFWLSSLPELKVLVLRSNAFYGPVLQASFTKLQIIDISHNHFNGTLPSGYFVKWSAMSSLEDWSYEHYMGDEGGYYYDSMVLVNKGIEMDMVRRAGNLNQNPRVPPR